MYTTHAHALENEKKLLLGELENIAVVNSITREWQARPLSLDEIGTADENDRADRFEDYEERNAMVKTLSIRLADVEDALAKIKNKAYGTCEVCGGKIEDARLQANPAARTCEQHL